MWISSLFSTTYAGALDLFLAIKGGTLSYPICVNPFVFMGFDFYSPFDFGAYDQPPDHV
jgi:hypothetical protein